MGCAAAYSRLSLARSTVSVTVFSIAACALSAASSASRTAFETNDGTKVTMTTPPFFGSRARIESGTLRL